ncbi:hypothetical protein [Micromonospora halotolerans]|uniref:hypothetical protein n=1 Tax=Micromonospora halotolerans TaxID=709879 RepID=UPI0035E3F946
MIERGSGRTSGLTDWRLMDVLSMWACLQDQDTTGQWKQVAGWRKICDLALAHVSRLREYRRGLAEAWPPETNAAARAYLGELDQLIDQVQRTHDAAAANYDALAAATRAIGSTRAELEPLFDEYAEKVRQKQAYEAILADPKAVAGSRLPEKPPVTDADLEQLNVRARGLMTGLSGELQQAQVMLRQPPPPARPVRDSPDVDAASSAAGPAPIIPPVVPIPAGPVTAHPVSGGTKPSKPLSGGGTGVRPVIGGGPVLGGVSSGLAPSPAGPSPSPSGTLPNTLVPPTPPNFGQPSALPPLTTPGRGSSPRSPLGGTGDGQFRPASPRELPNNLAQPSRPMQPGGLIGGVPGAGMGQSGAPVSPRRTNPVGGVIGGGAAGTSPTGAAGSRPGGARASAAHAMPPFGNSSSSGYPSKGPATWRETDHGGKRGWDPDDPWETDQGVDPVMRPPGDEGPIDPGPAIGFDR